MPTDQPVWLVTGCSTGFGAWGLDAVTRKLAARSAEVERWRAVGAGTDFPS